MKTILACIAVGLAGWAFLAEKNISQGTGIITATLLAGAGYLFKEVTAEEKTRQNICRSYAAFIEAQFREIEPSLSPQYLQRFLTLAPAIRSGDEAESVGFRLENPFGDLPDIKDGIHVLGHQTLGLLYQWCTEANNMVGIYDFVGSRRMADFSHDRLVDFSRRSISCVSSIAMSAIPRCFA